MNSKKNLVEKPKTAKPKVVAKPKATKKDLVEKPKPAKKATVNKSKTFAKPKATKKDLVEKPKPLDKPPKATKKATVNTLKEKPNNKKKGVGGKFLEDLRQSFSGIKDTVKDKFSALGRDFKTAISSSSKTTSSKLNDQSDNDESNIKYITEIVKKAKEKLKDLLEKIKSMDLDPSFSDSERLSIIEIYDKCNNNYIESKTDFDYKYSYEILINNNNNLKKQIKKTGFNETNKEELLILIKIFDLSKAIHHHYEDEDEDIKEEEDEDERNKQIIYDDVDLERLD